MSAPLFDEEGIPEQRRIPPAVKSIVKAGTYAPVSLNILFSWLSSGFVAPLELLQAQVSGDETSVRPGLLESSAGRLPLLFGSVSSDVIDNIQQAGPSERAALVELNVHTKYLTHLDSSVGSVARVLPLSSIKGVFMFDQSALREVASHEYPDVRLLPRSRYRLGTDLIAEQAPSYATIATLLKSHPSPTHYPGASNYQREDRLRGALLSAAHAFPELQGQLLDLAEGRDTFVDNRRLWVEPFLEASPTPHPSAPVYREVFSLLLTQAGDESFSRLLDNLETRLDSLRAAAPEHNPESVEKAQQGLAWARRVLNNESDFADFTASSTLFIALTATLRLRRESDKAFNTFRRLEKEKPNAGFLAALLHGLRFGCFLVPIAARDKQFDAVLCNKSTERLNALFVEEAPAQKDSQVPVVKPKAKRGSKKSTTADQAAKPKIDTAVPEQVPEPIETTPLLTPESAAPPEDTSLLGYARRLLATPFGDEAPPLAVRIAAALGWHQLGETILDFESYHNTRFTVQAQTSGLIGLHHTVTFDGFAAVRYVIHDEHAFRKRLQHALADPTEANELAKVVKEELSAGRL